MSGRLESGTGRVVVGCLLWRGLISLAKADSFLCSDCLLSLLRRPLRVSYGLLIDSLNMSLHTNGEQVPRRLNSTLCQGTYLRDRHARTVSSSVPDRQDTGTADPAGNFRVN